MSVINSDNDYDDDDYEVDVEQLFDEALENDPAFRAMLEAIDHGMLNTDLDSFEIALVASSALAAGEGMIKDEQAWLDSLSEDRPVQIAIRREGITQSQLPGRIRQAIGRMSYYGLWPWV